MGPGASTQASGPFYVRKHMTRHTKLYKTTYSQNKSNINVYYRDLTALEYSFLCNIKNDTIRSEIAGGLALYKCEPDNIPVGILVQIGQTVIKNALDLVTDVQLLEITVNEFRENINKDDIMMCIKFIIKCIPGQSITDLLNLTHKDLIELVCVCEELSGTKIFNFGKRKGNTLINPKTLEDDGANFQSKINELDTFLGK